MTETFTLALVLIPSLVIAIVFHEVAHGYAALLLGDTTARDQRRLTLNPLRHVDPVGTLLVPGSLALMGAPVFGWAKPVPVRQDRLDNPRYGMMAVAAAGPGTNFVLAALGAVALGFLAPTLAPALGDHPPLLAQGLFYFILINVFLGMFNLLPIPPFDGSHIVEGLLPRRYVHLYARLRPYGMLLFVGLVALTWFAPQWGVLENTIGPPVNWALEKYLHLASAVSGK
ncbi:MAG TPA: site-2 protease family protein [Erythrobacter sp.]|nr:site-2 protease family protein [Erythrobacter sp.]